MRLFVAEDEAPARERLIESVARVAPHARVIGWAASVRETTAWLARHGAPDLMLLDVQLSDGLSLELFRHGTLSCPTIFTTAYDEYVLDAFRALAVDYLLKPVDEARLGEAFARYERLRQHFGADAARLLQALQAVQPPAPPRWRQRLVGHRGTQGFALAVEQVAYFVSIDKLSFAVARDGRRYALDAPLAELEPELDPQRFFRANRQYLVSAAAITRFAGAGKGRLVLELEPAAPGEVAVSQERAAAFRRWLAQ